MPIPPITSIDDDYLTDVVGDDEHYLTHFERVVGPDASPLVTAYLRAARATRADGSTFRTALYAHNRAVAAQAIIDNDEVLPEWTLPGTTDWLDVLVAETRALRLIAGMLDGRNLAVR